MHSYSVSQEQEPFSDNPVDYFHWMSKDYMCILVYIVSSTIYETAAIFSICVIFLRFGSRGTKFLVVVSQHFYLRFQVSVIHAVLSGQMKNALKYVERGIVTIEKTTRSFFLPIL